MTGELGAGTTVGVADRDAPDDVTATAPAESATGRSTGRTLAVVALFAVLAVLMTFPRVDRIGTHVVGDNADAMLNLWTLDWVWDHWRHGWSTLWRGQTFQPGDRTLAYSESMLPFAALYGVVRLVVRTDAAAMNVALLATWTASQWWTWRLLRRVTTSDVAAGLGAVAWTFSAVRLGQQGHFQLAAGCFVPLVALCALRFLDVPSIRRGLELGASLAVVTLAASYVGLAALVTAAVILGIGLAAARRWPSRDVVVGLAAGAVLAGALVGPVAYEYLQLQRDPHFRRTPEQQFATATGDLLATAEGNRWLAEVPPFDTHRPANAERALFPGLVTTAMAAAGLVVLVRRRHDGADARARREVVLVVAAGVVLLLCAIGDHLVVAGHAITMPYRLLRAAVPPFAGIRATARFAVVWQLALAALAAVGAGALVGRLGRRLGAAACLALGAVVLAESTAAVPTVRVPDDPAWTAVNEELADRSDGLVLELPIRLPQEQGARGFIEAPREYLARIDDHPRVNGYSGFDPVGYGDGASTLNGFPAPAALALADQLGVRYVVIRTDTAGWFDAPTEAYLDDGGRGAWDDALAADRLAELPPDRVADVQRYGEAWLVELLPPPT